MLAETIPAPAAFVPATRPSALSAATLKPFAENAPVITSPSLLID
jgi:hypothetical protein